MSVTSHESIAPSRRTSVIFGYLLLSLLYAWNTPGAVVPIPLDLVEMGLPEDMTAEVVADEPCPRIESGPGRVVLTTVNHLNRDVHTLSVADTAGKVDDLGVTGFHKFYSLDRSAWVSCKDLHDNEQIRGFPDRRLTVVARSPLPGTHRVYNMTVEVEHVYHVGALGVLAHNNGCSQQVAKGVGRSQRAGENRGLIHVLENSAKSADAQDFEDAAMGAASDVATRKRIVPALRFDNPNPRGTSLVRFDGVDANNPLVLIDRKIGATTKSKQIRDMQRAAEALRQNPEFSLRIEVPDKNALLQVERLLDKGRVRDAPITVEIVP